MLIAAGPDLDRQIERKLNGDAKKKTPPYSTSEKAASRLIRRLQLQDMPCTVERIEDVWFCTFWTSNSRERVATGSGETRALAIARGVMNARPGMGPSSSPKSDAMSRRIHWTRASARAGEEASCADCAVSLPPRQRDPINRLCSVCSWRRERFSAGSGGETITRPPRKISIARGENDE
jgi:hypothetical protein